jgi:hypothetical protein
VNLANYRKYAENHIFRDDQIIYFANSGFREHNHSKMHSVIKKDVSLAMGHTHEYTHEFNYVNNSLDLTNLCQRNHSAIFFFHFTKAEQYFSSKNVTTNILAILVRVFLIETFFFIKYKLL